MPCVVTVNNSFQKQDPYFSLYMQFFATEPYACEPSSLPQYPPSKEMDAKRRDEEARRFVALTLTNFYLCFAFVVLDALYCHLCKTTRSDVKSVVDTLPTSASSMSDKTWGNSAHADDCSAYDFFFLCQK